jgi:hypothetical protein
MKFPAFFRRRSLVLPTLLGWLLILLFMTLVVVMLFRNMAAFLTVNEPVGADYLVIEGWMDKAELNQSLKYFEAHDFAKAIIVGGPISNDFHRTDSHYAQRAAEYLHQQGLSREKTAIVKSPYSAQARTFLNAVMVREWFKQEGIVVTRLDVFSSGVHTRRSRDLYRQAFGEGVAIGIIASRPLDFDPAHWWRTSGSGKDVAVEFAAWFLIKCCFNPGDPGSHLERWGIPKRVSGAN